MTRHQAIGVVGGLCATILLATTSIATDPPDFDCDVVTAESQVAAIDTVVARIVFVAFPNEGAARQDLPNWASTLRAELETFYNEMSFGQHVLDIEVLTRTDEPTKAWIADFPACNYSHYGPLNQEIMVKIHQDDPLAKPWEGVEQVFMIHYTCVWGPTLGCGTPGIAGLGVSGIPFFGGGGTSQHMLSGDCSAWPPINNEPGIPQYEWAVWGAAHEYGHRVPGIGHPPHSRNNETPVVDYGHYDVMNGNSSWPKYQQGLMPLHSLQLFSAQWKTTQEIAGTTLDLRIGDICNPASVLYQVATPNPLQKFLLVNYQASGFDLKYGNSGLLVWHIVEPLLAWDLEVATGKFTAGQPDPEAGQDLLEEPGSYVGSATDFFPASATTHFTPVTNPHTYLYASGYDTPQSVATSVSIENITKDPGSSDMIADVYLEPIQFVTTPNGGEYHASGNDLLVTWRYRPVGVSGIATVDVGLSYDGGQSYPVEYTGQTNTGSFAFSGLSGMGDEFRVRVVSYDPIASAFDVSDADFTVWDILETSVSEAVTVMCENDREIVRINASWLTSVATDGLDELRVYRPSAQSCPTGQPSFTKTASPNGASHQVIADSGCVTGLWSYVVTSTLGTGQTVSNCYSFNVTSCPSCHECFPDCF